MHWEMRTGEAEALGGRPGNRAEARQKAWVQGRGRVGDLRGTVWLEKTYKATRRKGQKREADLKWEGK